MCFQRVAHVGKSLSMQQHSEQLVGKQRRVELKSVGNFVAKTVLVESANLVSLEERCRTQYSLKYFSLINRRLNLRLIAQVADTALSTNLT